ncbi:MAG: (Fe-S)-binding protein [Deltaproteobacteria bacterium]|nr:(Fe-S)-binding protein [Deltaproteobacteria bacterium]
MEFALIPPGKTFLFFIPNIIFSIAIPVLGIAIFLYFIFIRATPLLKAAPDMRWNNLPERIRQFFTMWLFQIRQPRYMFAGVLHILLFAGFLILSIRSTEMVILGVFPKFVIPGFNSLLGTLYYLLKDYASTWVLIVVVVAMIRRGIFTPDRYAVPSKYGKAHTGEALFVLAMIGVLMITESLFDGSLVSAQEQKAMHTELLAPLSLSWFWSKVLIGTSVSTLQGLHTIAYYIHDLTFFTFLCFLPLGKHFHVITSAFNVFFMRTRRGNIKPVRYGVSDEKLDDLESFGVKRLEDFTWKHILDFYSCADCGRCSDNCPANTVGRPLSPRFISIKGRDLTFRNYPIFPIGAPFKQGENLIGGIFEENEIWSCTTCGACEQECPLGIEYIDKIVDLRRGMVDEGVVPQSLQKPLSAIEKRGNPWGKLEKKRVEWTNLLPEDVHVKVLDGKHQAEILYFVDSITSFDDRMQAIGCATATILSHMGENFGILGVAEKDSGHEVRRFGEEMLFQDLRSQNTEAILKSGISRIITSDPHAFNALKNDYENIPPVEHISQYLARKIRDGQLKMKRLVNGNRIYTYHDPCYLGRHNGLYDEPRAVLDAIPGIKRVDMIRCRDRSFCCGGGGLMLFYEPEEEQRMGVLRVQMAVEAGANVIVTACPFCLVNIEDAIKVAGMEGQVEAIDLAELIAQYME